jgi:protein-S-isoprenylcysteine O-methyltransferase Ste14
MLSDAPQRTLSIFGVGPIFVACALVYSAIGIGARLLWPDVLTIHLVPGPALPIVGGVLVALGTPVFLLGVRALARGFPEGQLFTRGAYAVCRHPIYGAWVSLIVPGMGLIMRSWPVLAVVPAMYVTLRILVRKEEAEMDRLFGEAHRAYRSRTPAVFPMLHRIFS